MDSVLQRVWRRWSWEYPTIGHSAWDSHA